MDNHPNFVKNAYLTALELFPDIYAKTKIQARWRAWHMAFAYEKNRLVGIGHNNPILPNNKVVKLGKFANVYELTQLPFLHAETDLFSRMMANGIYISNRLNYVFLRLNSRGELQNSKPCKNCQKVIDCFGITSFWYSNAESEIIRYEG